MTALLLAAFAAASIFDRERGQPAAGPDARELAGSLLLLGGADSTTRTGALVGFDPRAVGFRSGATTLVSYRGVGESYDVEDTRLAPRRSALVVARHVEVAEEPVALLGHSQAALILDHMIRDGRAIPDRAAVVAGPPPTPPQVAGARAQEGGHVGKVAARGLQALLELAGVATFDIDAEAAPVNLEDATAPANRTTRLNVWALGDSVWLDGDWRRPGEINVVVLTDHVGAVKNPRTLTSVGDLFAGERLASDESSWRAVLVNVVRFAFEPWRP